MKYKKELCYIGLTLLLGGCASFGNKPAQTISPKTSQVSSVTAPTKNITTQAVLTGSAQTGRYMTANIGAQADQVNPLLTVVTFKFTPDIQTIGQALNQVLQYSGYSLVSVADQSQAVQETLTKPLPYSVRNLGPIQIQNALTVLMGQDVFTLVVDPLHRLVNFDLKTDIQNALYPVKQVKTVSSNSNS